MASAPEDSRPTNMKLNVGKAGMQSVNVERVNEIILQASKGSNFYLHKQQRQKQIESKIEEMKVQLASFTEEDIQAAQELMDKEVAKLETDRDLGHVIVHLDMDAFYAAVEMRDDPSLKDVPMAVGCQSMLSTSNYIARTFGVRAAMPGFIAKKICPQLVIVKPNFDKYIVVSDQVKEVLTKYDPDFSSMSLDEASLDISKLTDERHGWADSGKKTREEIAEDIVQEMRFQVFEKTGLTCSAGIACNTRLAKICSNMNKPNGQFCVPASVAEIKKFIGALPVEKVCGIGNVTEQQLNALGILTCGDLYDQRGLLHLLFSEISSSTFLRISLGLGGLIVKCDEPRKFMSVERCWHSSNLKGLGFIQSYLKVLPFFTHLDVMSSSDYITFKDTSNLEELKQWCMSLSKLLSEDLRKEETVGKLVTLKIKTTTFQTRTKAKLLPRYTSNADIISSAALHLLEQEEKYAKPDTLKLRLMGVRMSTLITESEKPILQQLTLEDSMMSLRKRNASTAEALITELLSCPVCNSVELPAHEISNHVNTCLGVGNSSPISSDGHLESIIHESVACVATLPSGSGSTETWHCPVCNVVRSNEDAESMNNHIDNCLNRKAVRQILQEDMNLMPVGATKRCSSSSKSLKSSGKRSKLSHQGMRAIDTFFKT